MSTLGLSELETTKLKTICEYLFFDQFHEYASFPRFEQCFQPLFNDVNISLDSIYKEICGPKKKYINYPRLVKSYIKCKSQQGNISNNLKYFFQRLLNEILMTDNCTKGQSPEICFRYSTKIANSKRGYISLIEVLTDTDGIIHGLIVEYDGIFKNRMYPSKIEDKVNISLEMNLGIIDEQPILKGSIGKFMGLKEKFFRDSVTHIFGTFDKETKLLSFLGFKCTSGKTVFVGFPKGEGFLFGKVGNKLSQIRIEMTEQGVTKIEPIFDENIRPNIYLSDKANKLTINDLNKDELIMDEDQLVKLTNEDEIDKLITTPVINDDKFFNKKLLDIISGNDYKEVVNQAPRKWLINKKGPKPPQKPGKLPTLNDALTMFEQEKQKRGKKQVLFLPEGGLMHKKGKVGNIPLTQSIIQHTKKKLDLKGPQGRPPRMFGPKGFDPQQFVQTLAGYAQTILSPHGKPGMPGHPHALPSGEGQKKMNQQESSKNQEIPSPLCEECRKLFGLTDEKYSEKLRLKYYKFFYLKTSLTEL